MIVIMMIIWSKSLLPNDSDDDNHNVSLVLRNDSLFFPIKPSLVDDLTTFIKARLAKTRPHLQDPLVLYILECITLFTAASGTRFVTCS